MLIPAANLPVEELKVPITDQLENNMSFNQVNIAEKSLTNKKSENALIQEREAPR